LRTDTNCIVALTLRLDGAMSQEMRQFPQVQLPHVIDFIRISRACIDVVGNGISHAVTKTRGFLRHADSGEQT
jgi:hypothetical protein